MAEKHTISCDRCGATAEQTARAGSLEGWLRRDVIDSVNKRLAEGMRDFSRRITLHVCPRCVADASDLPSPPTHPEVLAFVDQIEENVPSDLLPPAEEQAEEQPPVEESVVASHFAG